MNIVETTESVNVRVEVPLDASSWLLKYLTNKYKVERDVTLMTERVPVIQAGTVPIPPHHQKTMMTAMVPMTAPAIGTMRDQAMVPV